MCVLQMPAHLSNSVSSLQSRVSVFEMDGQVKPIRDDISIYRGTIVTITQLYGKPVKITRKVKLEFKEVSDAM